MNLKSRYALTPESTGLTAVVWLEPLSLLDGWLGELTLVGSGATSLRALVPVAIGYGAYAWRMSKEVEKRKR
jgi:hypothetical protein